MYPKLTERVISLARRTEFSEDDWFVLLQERADAIKEFLHSMTLPTIGSLKFIRDYFHEHSFDRDSPEVTEGLPLYSLETRGIYPLGSRSEYDYTKGESYYHPSVDRFWGLTRDGKWIGVEVTVTSSSEPYKHPGRFEKVSKAQTMKIREFGLPDLCVFSKQYPYQIWGRLGEAIAEWMRHREQLLADAQRLHSVFEHERTIINAIAPDRPQYIP